MNFKSEQTKAEKDNMIKRVKSAIDCAQNTQKKEDEYLNKNTKKVLARLGRTDYEKLCADLQIANENSCKKRSEIKANNIDFQRAYSYALLLSKKGYKVSKIAEELNNVGYRAPRGGKFIQQHINVLLKDGKRLLGEGK